MGRFGLIEIIILAAIVIAIIYYLNKGKGSRSNVNDSNKRSTFDSQTGENTRESDPGSNKGNKSQIPPKTESDRAGIR